MSSRHDVPDSRVNYNMPNRVTLLSLQTFGATGGIQKMTRTLAYALTQVAQRNRLGFELWSVYDRPTDIMPQYISPERFKGFGINKLGFVLKTLKLAKANNVVIISHINMAVIGLTLKLLSPRCKVWLIAHGIEVWRPLSAVKQWFLNKCDKVICVSNFTKQQLISRHGASDNKCVVLNNTIDPFMTLPKTFEKPGQLLSRYGLKPTDAILFTLTRLAATEQYKGYEQVISIINKVKAKVPHVKYVLSGPYDDAEKGRLRQLIALQGLEEQVILTGFINENELADHFLMADLFILPSKKEGFGMVFIEAMACGLPVICGNADGSMDAIKNGELGTAINPDDTEDMAQAIIRHLENPLSPDQKTALQKKCLQYFNADTYTDKLQQLILND